MKPKTLNVERGWNIDLKIVCFEPHTVEPWLATADETRRIAIWDYKQRSLIRAFHPSAESAGPIKDIKFFDNDTLRWKWVNKQTSPTVEAFQGIGGNRSWLIILFELKVIFINYATKHHFSVSNADLDLRGLTCIEMIDSNYLAVGSTDGTIRIWDFDQNAPAKTLPRGAHLRNITHLLAFSNNLRQRPLLISASSDGVLAIWNIDTCNDSPSFRIPSTGAAHSGAIISMSLHPEEMLLATVGSEKSLAVWNVLNASEVNRFKNLKDPHKKGIIGSAFLRHPSFTESDLVVYAENSLLLTMNALQKPAMTVLQDLNSIKMKTKVSCVKVHPLLPYILFVATTHGLLVLNIDKQNSPRCLVSENLRSKTKLGAYIAFIYREGVLTREIYTLNSEELMSSVENMKIPDKLEGPLDLKISPSGNFISALSEHTGLYTLFFLDSADQLQKVNSGFSTSLVWHSSIDQFAVISPVNEDDALSSFASLAYKLMLFVYEVDRSNKVSLIFRGDHLSEPYALFGGTLLGISTKNRTNEVDFFSWESMQKNGTPISTPTAVFWTMKYVAICYPDQFFVYEIAPKFRLLHKVRHSVRTAIWYNSLFFYTTDRDLFWLVPSIATPFVFASHVLDKGCQLGLENEGMVMRKPPEACKLLGIVQEQLLMVTGSSRLVNFELKSDWIKFCMMIASNQFNEALYLCQKFNENTLKLASKSLAGLGYPEYAIQIPNLNFVAKLKISLKFNLRLETDNFAQEVLENKEEVDKKVGKYSENTGLIKNIIEVFQNEGLVSHARNAALSIKDYSTLLDCLMKEEAYGRAWVLANNIGNKK